MLPSKAKSGIFEASNNKNAQGVLRVSKTSRTGSTKSDTGSTSPMAKLSSPTPKLRASVDRSPKSVESKTTSKNSASVDGSPKSVESKTTNKSTTPDKLPRAARASELQEKLDAVDKDLKKAREQLASVELEKDKAIEELNEAKRLADEANKKLHEATDAQKKAEKSLEIEKFQANELEKSGKEAAQKREEEFQKEIGSIRSKYALDVCTLNSMTQELQRIKTELTDVSNAKEVALSQADDAKKTAETYGEKAELLSEEVSRLRALHDSKLDNMNKEAAEMIKKLNAEVSTLKLELERAKGAEEKLAQMEALVEKLQMEVTHARKGESDASKLVDEWRKKTERLTVDLEEAYQSEKSASDSLAAMMVQLEESKSLLEDAESEMSTLQGKIKSLEIEVAKQKTDLEESDRQLDSAQQDALNIGKTVELLKLELQNLEEEKLQAVNNEKVAASRVKSLMEENNKLIDDLKISNNEGEMAKKAMEGLASASQAMSTEAREKEERLLRTQAEIEESQAEIEQLNIALRNTEERYDVMLDEARYEIVCLKKIIERFETEASNSSNEWNTKELNFVNTIRKLEEEVSSLKNEMTKMVDLQKVAKKETEEAKADVAAMLTKLRQAESRANSDYEVAKESKHQSFQLKEILLDKENELQSIAQENDDLRIREAAALQKASALLTLVTAKKIEENCGLSNGKKFNPEKGNSEIPLKKLEDLHKEDHKQKEETRKGNKNHEEDTVEVMDNDLASEMDNEEESIDDDLESNMDGSSTNLTDGTTGSMEDGTTSPTRQHQHQKKKKALLHKFGNLLKNKNY